MKIERSSLGFKALLMLVVSGSLVGLGPVIAKLIAAPAVTIVLYRIALPIPILYFLSVKGNTKHVSQVQGYRDKILMALIGLFFALDLAAFYISLKYTSVTTATLLSNLSPLFLSSYALIKSKRITREIVWLLISLIGLVFLCGAKNVYSGDEIIGYISAITAAVFFSGYILLINRMGARYSSADIMFWSSLGGSVFLFIACLVFNVDISIKALDSILYILLLAFGIQLIGQTMLTKVISVFPPALSSVGILIDPVAAAFFSWLVLSESLNAIEIVGAILILSGIFGSYHFHKNKSEEEMVYES